MEHVVTETIDGGHAVDVISSFTSSFTSCSCTRPFPSSVITSEFYTARIFVQPWLVRRQSIKKPILRFRSFSKPDLKLLTDSESTSFCVRLFQRFSTRREKKCRRQSWLHVCLANFQLCPRVECDSFREKKVCHGTCLMLEHLNIQLQPCDLVLSNNSKYCTESDVPNRKQKTKSCNFSINLLWKWCMSFMN